MGCGCGRKVSAKKKIKSSKKSAINKYGSAIRKKRLTRLVSTPGRSAANNKVRKNR
jgi:hypothetical protein|tara:strand:- start:1985 stop:2152 length:168 start_codon:yes stop_codon:yes gene_type:complete